MAQPPHKIFVETPEEQKVTLLNDNFDKVLQDINDLGARFTTGVSGSISIAANSEYSFTVAVRDIQGQYVKDQMPIFPRVDAAVDVNDAAHYLPDGGALTTAQLKCEVHVRVAKTSRNNFPDEKATYLVTLFNNDSAAHTVFITGDAFYIQSNNSTGIFR